MDAILLISSILLWLGLIFTLLLTLALTRRLKSATPGVNSESRTRPYGLVSGTKAPSFEARTLTDAIESLSDYSGRSLALIFIGTRCQICIDVLPHLELLASRISPTDIGFLLVSGDDENETREWARDNNVSIPIVLAPRDRSQLVSDYKVSGTPVYYLIGPSGRIESAGLPNPDIGEWSELSRAWLSGTSPALPSVETEGEKLIA